MAYAIYIVVIVFIYLVYMVFIIFMIYILIPHNLLSKDSMLLNIKHNIVIRIYFCVSLPSLYFAVAIHVSSTDVEPYNTLDCVYV